MIADSAAAREADQALVRAVVMGMGKPRAAKGRALTLRLALLLILLGLTVLVGLASTVKAAGNVGPVAQGSKKATGGRGVPEVTPLEKFHGNFGPTSQVVAVEAPGNNLAANRAVLFDFLQSFSSARTWPDRSLEAAGPPSPKTLQMFPVTERDEQALGGAPAGPVPAGLLIALAVLLWALLAISIRSRRPW